MAIGRAGRRAGGQHPWFHLDVLQAAGHDLREYSQFADPTHELRSRRGSGAMADASGFWFALDGLIEAEATYVRRLEILKTRYKDPMLCARHIEPDQAKVLFSMP